MIKSAFGQSTYQVRLDWGVAGLSRLAPADVVIVVDVLGLSSTVALALAEGGTPSVDAAADSDPTGATAVAAQAAAGGAVVLLGGLCNASAVARAVMAIQHERASRTSISVIAAGEVVSSPSGSSLRFAVEDHLGAGAIVDALGALGIDHTSPEAAAAGEAFRALRGAVRHLLTASGSGRELVEQGRRDEVLDAAQADSASIAPVLRGGAFVACARELGIDHTSPVAAVACEALQGLRGTSDTSSPSPAPGRS